MWPVYNNTGDLIINIKLKNNVTRLTNAKFQQKLLILS